MFEGIVYHAVVADPERPCRPTLEVDAVLRPGDADGPILALIVLLAMVGACVSSGIFGALVPLGLRRLGADPATASSIFLTTATDVASMGLFLGLATILLL